MCANYETISLAKVPRLKIPKLPQPEFDFVSEAYPGDFCPILVSGQNDDMVWRQAIFGLVPSWAENVGFSRNTYNARTETVATKPSFRTAWRDNQFALIPMQAFYEPSYETGKAIRHKIQRLDEEPFTVAAIWDQWSDHLNSYRSFSMLTINADEHPFMKRFHKPGDEKRSIVVVPPDLRDDWIHADHKTVMQLLNEMALDQFTATPAPLVRKSKSKPMNNELF